MTEQSHAPAADATHQMLGVYPVESAAGGWEPNSRVPLEPGLELVPKS